MRLHTVVAIVVAILVPGWASAQVAAGVKGGFVSASLSTEGFQGLEADAGAGGAVGGFVDFGAGVVGFRPEVLVTWRRFTLSDGEESRRSGSTSIEVPLLLCVRTANPTGARGVLFAGPQLNFITSVWQETGGSRSNLDEAIKDWDAGLTFGGGVEIPAGRGAVTFDARMMIGLRNLWEPSGPTIESRAFAALMGYRF